MDAAAPDAQEPPRASACSNCGAPAGGTYCPACGQETAIGMPSARQFLKDAAGRYVALDGRLWRTLVALLFRPGFLTREYFAGRRRRYIRPSRLFLVLSLVMFATMRIVVGVPELAEGAFAPRNEGPASESPPPTDAITAPRDGSVREAPPSEGARVLLPGISLTFGDDGNVAVDGPGPIASALRQRMARFNALPRQERLEQMVLGTLRYGPYAMFVLLPAFAFLLMGVYVGGHSRYPSRPRRYAEHLVYAAHNHAFVFLLVTFAVALPWRPLDGVLPLWALVYNLWSMKAVYGGRWIGVFARAWLLALAYFVLFVLVTVALVVAAVVVR